MIKNALLKRTLFFSIVLMANVSSYAQDAKNDLEFVVNQIKHNYPGFKIKTTQREFDRLVESTIEKSPLDTFHALSLIVNSFSDQHLRLYQRKKYIRVDSEACSNRLRNWVSYLSQARHLHKYEGYWKDDNNSCVIAIRRKNNNEYEAIVIETRANQLRAGEIISKMERVSTDVYLTDFRNANSGSRCFINSRFRNDSILVTGVEGKWRKLNAYEVSHSLLQLFRPRSDTASGILLNNTTYLILIPTSSINNVRVVEEIIKRDSNIIAHTSNLIIDIRGNTGGKSSVFDPIYPWIYTNPIVDVCGDIYSTPDGIDQYVKKIESMKNDSLLTEEEIRYAESKIQRMKANLGEFVESQIDTLTLNEVRKFPNHVGVILDYACQSAAEMFLLNAQQSKKVVLFGEPSRGAIDYLDFYPINSPSNAMVLFMPISKRRISKGGELDGKGIKPRIAISDSEPNWVNYAEAYLSNL